MADANHPPHDTPANHDDQSRGGCEQRSPARAQPTSQAGLANMSGNRLSTGLDAVRVCLRLPREGKEQARFDCQCPLTARRTRTKVAPELPPRILVESLIEVLPQQILE